MQSSGTQLSRLDPLADSRGARWLEGQTPATNKMSARDSWEPIDTAPRDGTAILAWVSWQNASASACIVAFTNKRWRRVRNSREIAGEALRRWMRIPSGLKL